jgi:hypothetical protein
MLRTRPNVQLNLYFEFEPSYLRKEKEKEKSGLRGHMAQPRIERVSASACFYIFGVLGFNISIYCVVFPPLGHHLFLLR